MIVDKPQKALLLLEHVERKETPGLKMVILMEPFEEALTDRGQGCGVVIKSMQAVEVRGCLFRALSGPPSQSCQRLPLSGPRWMLWAVRLSGFTGLVVGEGGGAHRHPLRDRLGWLAQLMTQVPTGGWCCQPAPELLTQPLEHLCLQPAISLSEPEVRSHGEVLANMSQAPSRQQDPFFCAWPPPSCQVGGSWWPAGVTQDILASRASGPAQ